MLKKQKNANTKIDKDELPKNKVGSASKPRQSTWLLEWTDKVCTKSNYKDPRKKIKIKFVKTVKRE